MDKDFDFAAPAATPPGRQAPSVDRRTESDRRSEGERRRSTRGWFELRARREGIAVDRRQHERREGDIGRLLLAFWRRQEKI